MKPCNFKECDGTQEILGCGCSKCDKCERTDGTECTYQ